MLKNKTNQEVQVGLNLWINQTTMNLLPTSHQKVDTLC